MIRFIISRKGSQSRSPTQSVSKGLGCCPTSAFLQNGYHFALLAVQHNIFCVYCKINICLKSFFCCGKICIIICRRECAITEEMLIQKNGTSHKCPIFFANSLRCFVHDRADFELIPISSFTFGPDQYMSLYYKFFPKSCKIHIWI